MSKLVEMYSISFHLILICADAYSENMLTLWTETCCNKFHSTCQRAVQLTSIYSSRPYFEPSRPSPDCFMPPNGATCRTKISMLHEVEDVHLSPTSTDKTVTRSKILSKLQIPLQQQDICNTEQKNSTSRETRNRYSFETQQKESEAQLKSNAQSLLRIRSTGAYLCGNDAFIQTNHTKVQSFCNTPTPGDVLREHIRCQACK